MEVCQDMMKVCQNMVAVCQDLGEALPMCLLDLEKSRHSPRRPATD